MEYKKYKKTINIEIPLRHTHCFIPAEAELDLVLKHIENCFINLAKDAPRGAIRELQYAVIEISKMAPLVNPSIDKLGGGISENLKQGEKVGEIEKTHLIINRIMKNIASEQKIEYIDVGTDNHYPFYFDYKPTLKAKESIKNHVESITNYPSSYGLIELRQSFARFMEYEFDVKLDCDAEIMVATGASQVFDAVSRAFSGEYFVIPDLALPTVSTIAVSNGARPLRVPFNEQTGFIDLDYLEDKMHELNYPSIRFLYINYPTNPSGKIINKEELKDIVEFCKKYNILLIHDMDSWRTLHNKEKEQINLLQIEGGKEVGITIFSVSKEFGLPGLRVGLVAGNRKLIDIIRLHNSLFCVMLPELNQYAVISALNEYCNPNIDNKDIINKRITDILNYCLKEWNNLGWNGEHIMCPDGGFKFLLRVPPKFVNCGKYNKAELFVYHIVKETKIKLSSSTSFNPENSEFIRMIVMQDLDKMQELFKRLRCAGINYNMDMPSNLVEDYEEFLKSINENKLNDF